MTYAHRPDIYDADTHKCERPDWVASFADPDIRPRLTPFADGDPEGLRNVMDANENLQRRRTDAGVAAEADAQFMSMRYKGCQALGAFDAEERRRAKDLLGFQGGLVFPTRGLMGARLHS